MRLQNLCLLTCALLVFAALSCAAPPTCTSFADESHASRWIRAIVEENWQEMGELLAEDAVYEDTTMRYFDRDPVHLVGPKDIVNFWTQSASDSGTTRLDYTLLDRFETGGVTVLHLHLSAEVGGEFWGVDQETIMLSGRVTTVLTVDDGKISHVHDHVEYDALMRQVEAMRSQAGS